jgi:hypothetical protein
MCYAIRYRLKKQRFASQNPTPVKSLTLGEADPSTGQGKERVTEDIAVIADARTQRPLLLD